MRCSENKSVIHSSISEPIINGIREAVAQLEASGQSITIDNILREVHGNNSRKSLWLIKEKISVRAIGKILKEMGYVNVSRHGQRARYVREYHLPKNLGYCITCNNCTQAKAEYRSNLTGKILRSENLPYGYCSCNSLKVSLIRGQYVFCGFYIPRQEVTING